MVLYPYIAQHLSLKSKNILLHNHNAIIIPKTCSINSEMLSIAQSIFKLLQLAQKLSLKISFQSRVQSKHLVNFEESRPVTL